MGLKHMLFHFDLESNTYKVSTDKNTMESFNVIRFLPTS